MIIAIQSTYTGIEIGLHSDSRIIQQATIDKKNACAELIPTLDKLLEQASRTLTDVEYIIVNKGPGPYTSLRTVIATINGIAFTTKIPLIGVNALEVMMHEYDPHNQKTALALLNAYGKEYYYGFKPAHGDLEIGTCSYSTLPAYSKQDPIHIIGHIETITSEETKQYAHSILIPHYMYSTLHGLADYGVLQYKLKVPFSTRLSPVYLKNHF